MTFIVGLVYPAREAVAVMDKEEFPIQEVHEAGPDLLDEGDPIPLPGRRRDLTKGNVLKLLVHMALPVAIGLFFNTMFNVVDTYFAGQLATEALAALSVSFPVFFIIIALTEGLAVGASALVSYHLGRGEEREASEICTQVLVYGVLGTVVLMTVGLNYAEDIFLYLGATGAYLDYALQYIHVVFWGAVFFVAASAFAGILLAHGDSTALRNVLVAGFFLNCTLDPWFLWGGFGIPPMGIRGIALATVVIKALSAAYLMWVVEAEGLLTVRSWRAFIPRWKVLSRLTIHSLPASLNMMTVAVGMFICTYFIKQYGPAAVAAYGIGLRIEQIMLLPTIGVAIGTLSLVGQNYGAGHMDRVSQALRYALSGSWIFISIGVVFVYLWSYPLVSLFSDDPLVLQYGSQYLRIAVFISWAYVTVFTCSSALQAMHHPYFVATLGLFRQFVGRIGLFYLVINYTQWGIGAMWWSLLVLNWMTAVIMLGYTAYLIWRGWFLRAPSSEQ